MEPLPKLYTMKEAWTALRICKNTLYGGIDDGSFPKPLKIRRRSFYTEKQLIGLLENGSGK